MKTQVVTTATDEPLTLEEVKSHLRLELGETEQDDLLNGYIKTARDVAEKYTNRKFIHTTIDLYFDEWPDEDGFELAYSPMSTNTVPTVTYTDYDSSTITLSSTAWKADYISEPGRICLDSGQSWPSDTLHEVNPIKIRYQVGYTAESSNVPQVIKNAMLLMIGDLYENRENTIVGQMGATRIESIPMGAKALLSPHRVYEF